MATFFSNQMSFYDEMMRIIKNYLTDVIAERFLQNCENPKQVANYIIDICAHVKKEHVSIINRISNEKMVDKYIQQIMYVIMHEHQATYFHTHKEFKLSPMQAKIYLTVAFVLAFPDVMIRTNYESSFEYFQQQHPHYQLGTASDALNKKTSRTQRPPVARMLIF